jgi:branched-chain amino acid transport system substrate-binding protein
VQDIYLREVKGNHNELKGIAIKALADPAKGCRM